MTWLLRCCCWWLLCSSVWAHPLHLTGETKRYPLQAQVAWLVDEGAQLSIADVQQPEVAARFNTTPSSLSFGFSDAAIWLRWTMQADAGHGEQLLEVFPAWLDKIELYEITPQGVLQRVGGDRAPQLGDLDYRLPVFRLQVPSQPRTYFLRITSSSSMSLRLTLWQPQAFAEQTAKESTLQGVLIGLMLAMLLYNLVLLLVFRDRITVFYVGHCLFAMLSIATIDGHVSYLIHPFSPWLADRLPGFQVALSIAISTLFIQAFLRLGQTFPRIAKVFRLLTVFFAIGALAALMGYNRYFAPWVQSLAILAAILIMVLSFLLARRGWRPAYIILAGFSAWFLGATLVLLRNLGVLEANLLTSYAVQIGAATEVLLLSLALIERVRQAERDRKAAQEEALRVSQEAEQRLEQQVAERTVELEHSVERWKAANAEKSDVLGVVAHDLKNPIAVISAIADILRRAGQQMPAAEFTDWIERISGSCQRMTYAITHLLDLNALESGVSNLAPTTTDMAPLVTSLCAEFAALVDAKHLTLRTNVPEQLQAWVDAEAVKQVLDNLLSNAIKYSPRDKAIAVALYVDGPWARLEVRDQGPGLTAADQTHLFGKFARLSARPTAGESSTGLGLSIVKALVEAMQGEVWCDSEPGQGACFVVRLPGTERA